MVSDFKGGGESPATRKPSLMAMRLAATPGKALIFCVSSCGDHSVFAGSPKISPKTLAGAAAAAGAGETASGAGAGAAGADGLAGTANRLGMFPPTATFF